jgi:hypothetical protein
MKQMIFLAKTKERQNALLLVNTKNLFEIIS